MSTYTYSALTRKREDAKARESKKDDAPGFTVNIDTVAALVPVEVLLLHAALLEAVPPNELRTLRLAFGLCLGGCFLIYLLGHIATGGLQVNKSRVIKGQDKLRINDCLRNPRVFLPDGWDWFLMFVPAGAFVAWTMLQKDTLFDAVVPTTTMPVGSRLVFGGLLAFVVGVIAWLNAQWQDTYKSYVGKDDDQKTAR
jgi:hypothetical protein